ncbi:SDR family oxidoreductase [Ottowia thiooxydans]|uniref:SDR family oxidoreductase n=1 Tax=Ottowia thiooxydans TaxID=219182 RepID=UPI00040DADBD|nr:SDR family oxidoreductase [Ottowia thiooxydans]
MPKEGGTMLVAGATGVAAQNLIEIVRKAKNWKAIGLSRNPPASLPPSVQHIAADMMDAEGCKRALKGVEVTHLVFAARAKHKLYTTMAPGAKVGVENVEPNIEMLRNVVAACEGSSLRHVHVIQGSKWYGFHMGPYPTPAKESAPGHMPPNFYFDQQKFLESSGGPWTWSTSRPAAINGKNVGSGPNLVSTLGVYALICKHLGLPLDFPGKPGAYKSLMELSDAEQVAESIFWMCNTPAAENQAFNVVNGDLFRWESIWPRIAEHYGMKMGTVRYFPLVQWMADKGPVWDEIVKTEGLQARSIDDVASWGFADFLLGCDFDIISSTTKIRQAGFHRMVDTEEMIIDQLTHYRKEKILA